MKKHSRKYLNRGSGLASIEWTVTHRPKTKSVFGYTDVDLTITDCVRQISLDFGVNTKSYADESLKKINLLIGELEKFKAAMIEAGKLKGTIK